MKCPKCQFENPEAIKFCGECGSKLERLCPSCNHGNPPPFRFCGECGHSLDQFPVPFIDYSTPQSYTPKFLAKKILTTRSALEGERKLVTVLFADVAGFTSLSERVDPEEVHGIMDGCFKILMDEIHKFEGTINQFTGDGVMALFGAPVAHEDHAQRACHAALAIQRAMLDYGDRVRKDFGVDFRMRMGLNSGPVIVGRIGDDLRMDYTAVGDTTNLAARVQQAAAPGEVWVSQETRGIIQGYFAEEPVGNVGLKGKTEPQVLYRVTAERPQVRTRFEAGLARGVTKLVGRKPEMESLRAAFERVCAGDAQVVDVVGEAGVGKSRLIYEFHQTIGRRATFLPGVCVQYGRSMSFFPVGDLVKAAFGIQEGMDEEEIGRRIQVMATNGLSGFLPFYRNLLSLKVDDQKFGALNPEGRKFGTFEAVKTLLLALSQQKPLVLFLEDVHWMDKLSEEFFTYFSHSIQGHPVMMLSAYRPEASPAWAQGAHYQKLGLETLSASSSIKLVRNILGGVPLDPELEQRIVEKSGGNPFFTEEIVRDLIERRDLVRAQDRYVCTRPLGQLVIPGTIQGVIAARMDRMSEDLKRTMQVASVIGRDFAYRILKSILELGDELRGHLTNLVGLEILYEKVLYPELEYIFKHALTQEVAYESLLKQRRREIHGRIARAVEELYADRLDLHYEILAHHWELSGNPEKAIEYLILAGKKSNRAHAVQSAQVFFKRALDLSQTHKVLLEPQTEAQVRLGLGSASRAIGDIDTAMEELKKAVEINRRCGMTEQEIECLTEQAVTAIYSESDLEHAVGFYDDVAARTRAVGRKAEESFVLSMKGFYVCVAGQRYQGCLITRDAERLALEAGDVRAVFVARLARAMAERWLGMPGEAVELTEGMVDAMLSMFNLDALSVGIYARGLALAETGRIEEAMKILTYGIHTCESLGGMIHLGQLYNCLGYCFMEIQNIDKARELNSRSQDLGRKLMKGYPSGRQIAAEIVAHANVNLMENLFDQEDLDATWNLMGSFEKESRSDDYCRSRDRWGTRMDALAATILLDRNDTAQAERIVQRNLDTAKKEHVKKYEGRFLRLLGEVQVRRGEHDNAIASMGEAIRILREVGNPRQLWQAHGSLASAYDRMGRGSEAREQWGAAAAVIHKQANGLSDRQLREGFLNARQIREILAKSGSFA